MKNILILIFLFILLFYSCKTIKNNSLIETNTYVYDKNISSDINEKLIIILNLSVNNTFSISESGTISPLKYDGNWKYINKNTILLECNKMKILSTEDDFPVPYFFVEILNKKKIKLYKNGNKKAFILKKQE
ncbi:hypothetical protein [uncultured Dysgonomonas sp.]|uniref:hypothetical protein n=1 Tax=uncultured Dysgonomonas sp. TaxID=206096 RepID=UPI0028054F90|nr:hypothetical protein [uncultured Dysgonomonas sp.]